MKKYTANTLNRYPHTGDRVIIKKDVLWQYGDYFGGRGTVIEYSYGQGTSHCRRIKLDSGIKVEVYEHNLEVLSCVRGFKLEY